MTLQARAVSDEAFIFATVYAAALTVDTSTQVRAEARKGSHEGTYRNWRDTAAKTDAERSAFAEHQAVSAVQKWREMNMRSTTYPTHIDR